MVARSKFLGLGGLRHGWGRRRISVLLLGTDDVTLPTLARLHASLTGAGAHARLVTALGVVCPGDRPAGRGQRVGALPVKAFAVRVGVPVWEVPYGVRDLREWHGADAALAGPPCGSGAWDLGVVVSFGYLVPAAWLERLRGGAINMHPSALPRWRGAAPIIHTLLAGDTKTAVTVLEVHPERFDAGRILAQECTPVGDHEDAPALGARLAELGADAVMRALASRQDNGGVWASAIPQVEAGITRAPKLRAGAGAFDPLTTSGALLRRMVRAYAGAARVFASAIVDKGGGGTPPPPRDLALLQLEMVDAHMGAALEAAALKALRERGGQVVGEGGAPGGMIAWHAPSKRLCLRASDEWVHVLRLQAAGRNPVSGAEFAAGLRMGRGGVHVSLVAASLR